MKENHVRAAYLRALAVEYGKSFLGTPYRWGGDDPMAGFDCSGFVVEVLQGVGVLPHNSDFSADQLMRRFLHNAVATGYQGCLAIWQDEDRRGCHVMLMVDAEHVIGASGGGSETINGADAIRQNAFLKLRPLSYRKGKPIILDPFKGTS